MIVRRLKNDELYHFGIKGQRWGVRRYQNPDGSLTDAGRKRYGASGSTLTYEDYSNYEKKQEKVSKAIVLPTMIGNFAGSTAFAMTFGLTNPIAGVAPFLTFPATLAVAAVVEKIKDKKLSEAKKMLPKKELERLSKVEHNNDKLADLQKEYSHAGNAQKQQEIQKQMEQVIRDNIAIQRLNQQQMNQVNQMNIQNLINQQTQMAVQQSIIDANRTASLGVSGGTNPYMFG